MGKFVAFHTRNSRGLETFLDPFPPCASTYLPPPRRMRVKIREFLFFSFSLLPTCLGISTILLLHDLIFVYYRFDFHSDNHDGNNNLGKRINLVFEESSISERGSPTSFFPWVVDLPAKFNTRCYLASIIVANDYYKRTATNYNSYKCCSSILISDRFE